MCEESKNCAILLKIKMYSTTPIIAPPIIAQPPIIAPCLGWPTFYVLSKKPSIIAFPPIIAPICCWPRRCYNRGRTVHRYPVKCWYIRRPHQNKKFCLNNWYNAVSLGRTHRPMPSESWEMGGNIIPKPGGEADGRGWYCPHLEGRRRHWPMRPSQTHGINIVIE